MMATRSARRIRNLHEIFATLSTKLLVIYMLNEIFAFPVSNTLSTYEIIRDLHIE